MLFTTHLNHPFIKSAFYILGLILIAGCSQNPKVLTTVQMPARVDAMTKVKSMALYELKNDQLLATGKIEALLKSIKDNTGKAYFEIVNRDDMSLIIKELKTSNNALFDDSKIIELGKLAKVDAIVTGTVQKPVLNRESRTETRTESRCAQNDKKGRCTLWLPHNYTVNCTRSESAVNFQIRITSVKTGKIINSNSYSGQRNHDTCGNTRVPSLASLQKNALRDALRDFRRDVAPYKLTLSIKLLDGDDQTSNNSKAQAHLEKGLSFVNTKSPNFRRGCLEFQKGIAQFAHSPSLLYNLGVCQEVEGNLARASEFFKRAENALEKPNKVIAQAVARVNKRENDLKNLKRQQKR